jgi:hypothetical protein
MPKQSGQQRQRMIRNGTVNVRFLSVQGLGGAARRQMIPLIRTSVNDGGKELMYTRQSFEAILSIPPQRLAEHELSPIGEIPGIQPVMKAPRFEAYDSGDSGSRGPRIHTGNQEIRVRHILSATNELRHRLPVKPPEQIQPVD